MSRDEVYAFIETVNKIKSAQREGVPLSQYFPREIADAVGALIAGEREACAMIAEAAAEGSGAIGRGDRLDANPVQRKTAFEIAERIRNRK
jgi:hypothetical protein